MPATRRAPRRSRPVDDETTRARILEVALDAFSELGYDGASTRAIATRAHVNQGLIPYYFGTKEALWREAVSRAFVALEASRETLEASRGDARERFAALIRGFVRFVAANPQFVRMMNEEGKRRGPRMRWLVDHHVRPQFETVIELLRQVGEANRWPASIAPIHFHYIFVGAVTMIFHQAPECERLTGLDPTDPAMVEAHADAIIHLFLGPPEGENDDA